MGVGARGVAPDLAFNLFGAPAPDHPLPASPRLLLSFRADQRPEQAAEAEALALATARVVGAGAITCFAQVRLDEDPTTRLAASLESEGATTHVVVSRSIAASEAALAGADLVLTNRLHVALLALALGRPTSVARGVERQTKLDGALEGAGRPDLLHWIRDTDPAAITRRVHAATQRLDGRPARAALRATIAGLFDGGASG